MPVTPNVTSQPKHRRTASLLILAAFGMLGLGFASKPLYDTFCKVTGYGGTPQQADANNSDVIDRMVRVSFDSNVSNDLPWSFVPDVPHVDVNVGQSTLSYYKVTNNSKRALTGIATFNVTPLKAATYFTKTECFCFTEQTLQPGQSVDFPVIFFVDSLMDEDERADDVKTITLSYTFFESEKTKAADLTTGSDQIQGVAPATSRRDSLN